MIHVTTYMHPTQKNYEFFFSFRLLEKFRDANC